LRPLTFHHFIGCRWNYAPHGIIVANVFELFQETKSVRNACVSLPLCDSEPQFEFPQENLCQATAYNTSGCFLALIVPMCVSMIDLSDPARSVCPGRGR
jgi:hypothetical protein